MFANLLAYFCLIIYELNRLISDAASWPCSLLVRLSHAANAAIIHASSSDVVASAL